VAFLPIVEFVLSRVARADQAPDIRLGLSFAAVTVATNKIHTAIKSDF
jgi:hypothetical protein